MNENSWPPEWTRATLQHSALAIIAAQGETYGYVIIQHLERAGFGKVKGGTLYPILARLEAEGLITSRWGEGDGGPGRKFVAITESGREEMTGLRERWSAFAASIDELWSTLEKEGEAQ